jgi:predicted nucleotidyltransferase
MSDTILNVPAGTQVVLREEVRASNDVVIHPRGSVAIVTRTPAGESEDFLVRFPDGVEGSISRGGFEILKQFKNRTAPDDLSEGFNLEETIIYRCVAGSRAYGLDSESSDTDFRGVYLAPAMMQWSLFGFPGQFEDSDGQSCIWELQKFLQMALKANPNILECLYSPLVDKVTPVGEELLAIRGCFLSQMIFQTFNGYAMSQFKKIEQDRRNRGEVRWKHAMHLLRLLITGAAALREARLPVRVESHRDRLLSVRSGEAEWQEVDAWRVALHRDFEEALRVTRLPERPDYDVANRFLIKARQHAAAAV